MIKQGIKNLIFDFGEVLIKLDKQRCIQSFKELGIHNIDEITTPFAHEGAFMQLEKGEITAAEFRDKIRNFSNMPQLTDEQIDNAWNSLLREIPSYKLDALLQLKQIYNVYLLSNTNQIHWDWSLRYAFAYKGFGVEDFFLQTFLSYEMKQAKPDAEIFKTVIETTGIIPEESIFIDDLEANCQAASTLGFATYRAKPEEDWRHLFSNMQV